MMKMSLHPRVLIVSSPQLGDNYYDTQLFIITMNLLLLVPRKQQ